MGNEIIERKLKMYGAHWCGDCRDREKELNDLHIVYEYNNIAEDPQADKELRAEIAKDGIQNIPRFLVQRTINGQLETVETLIDPSTTELTDSLVSNGFI